MSIAISTEGNEAFPHFGHSPVFTIVDVVDGRIVGKGVIPNPGRKPGFIPRFMNRQGVELVVTGGMGARAQDIFQEMGMETVLGVRGNVDEVIERFLAGTLTGGASLCDHGSGKGYGVEKAVPRDRTRQEKNMKICISSEGNTLDSKVDPRFGRCRTFIIVDTETMVFQAVDNSGTDASGGAGIQAGQLVASRGAKAVLTGNVGPNACQTLQAAGIVIYTGVSGTVREAVDGFKKGLYQATGGPTAASKAGVKREYGR